MRKRILRFLPFLACAVAGLCPAAQDNSLTRFEAKAPVNDFSLPMFGPDGYKTWDLSGKQGRYVNQNQIDIDGLKLRLFSGDEKGRVEVVIESPKAEVDPKAGKASGPDFLYVNGPGYSVTGRDWFWNEKTKYLEIKKDVQVTFASGGEGSAPIVINSQRLTIETQADSYYFKFQGKVRVLNGGAEMQTPELEAWSSRAGAKTPQAGKLRSMRRILADQGVVVVQEGRRLTAQQAEMPEESGGREIVLTGKPELRDVRSDAILRGGEVRMYRDEQSVKVFPEKPAGEGGRVFASLPPSEKSGDRRMEITGARMEMHTAADGARELSFYEKVFVNDPGILVNCDTLTAHLPRGKEPSALTLKDDRSGSVDWISAKGNVLVEQQSRRTHAQEARIYPQKGEAVLTGKPLVADSVSGAVMEGDKIVLMKEKGKVLVFGSPKEPSRVMLAPLQDASEKAPTYIYSDSFQLTRGKDMSVVTFLDNVRVESGELKMDCGALDVFVDQKEGEQSPKASDDQSLGSIARIEARDQVRYRQEDMHGEAARVEVFPRATVKDEAGQSGPQRFVTLYGDPSGKKGPVRPKVFLQGLAADVGGMGPSRQSGDAAGETVVTSDEQELFTDKNGSRFYFRKNVEMLGSDFKMHCDEVEVVSGASPEGGRFGKPERVIASGNVVMEQGTRTAKAGLAEVSLRTGKCVLADKPVVTDSADGSRVDGYRITLLRGQNRVFVEGEPPAEGADSPRPRKRPSIVLPPFGDMGFDSLSKSSDKDK